MPIYLLALIVDRQHRPGENKVAAASKHFSDSEMAVMRRHSRQPGHGVTHKWPHWILQKEHATAMAISWPTSATAPEKSAYV
jgi:hypothetical protein